MEYGIVENINIYRSNLRSSFSGEIIEDNIPAKTTTVLIISGFVQLPKLPN